MIKAVEEAIEALKEMPEDRQETVARAILDYANDDGFYYLTDDEREEVKAGLAEVERGEIASDADVAKAYKQMGL